MLSALTVFSGSLFLCNRRGGSGGGEFGFNRGGSGGASFLPCIFTELALCVNAEVFLWPAGGLLLECSVILSFPLFPSMRRFGGGGGAE